MPQVISAIVTTAGRAALAKSFVGPNGGFTQSSPSYFKIGTAGHTIVNGIKTPNTPHATLTDITSVHAGAYYYRKDLLPTNAYLVLTHTVQVVCVLSVTDANGDEATEPNTAATLPGPKNTAALGGTLPSFYELGIYDQNDVLIAYATFPGELKSAGRGLSLVVNLYF